MNRDNTLLIPRLEHAAARLIGRGLANVEVSRDHRYTRKIVLKEHTTKFPCQEPYGFETFARQAASRYSRDKPISIIGKGRCRKCENCLKARSIMWKLRAIAEFKKWPVTAFGTITMSLDHHYLIDSAIMAGLEHNGRVVRYPQRLEELSSDELFSWRVRIFGEELQRYFKRLRKNLALETGSLRYLLVAEAHNGARTHEELRGRPHFHLLLHETVARELFRGNPVHAQWSSQEGSDWIKRKYQSGGRWFEGIFLHDDAPVRQAWRFGFTKYQFAENERAASYLCKYLSETIDARVRASLHYGEDQVAPTRNSVSKNTEEKMDPTKGTDL